MHVGTGTTCRAPTVDEREANLVNSKRLVRMERRPELAHGDSLERIGC